MKTLKYIIIEEGSIFKVSNLSKELIEAYEAGILSIIRCSDGKILNLFKNNGDANWSELDEWTSYITPKKFGCHCDLEGNQTPDECVIDSGKRHYCINATNIINKEKCEYWREIK